MSVKIEKINSDIYVRAFFRVKVQADQLTKLPGRPLTTDDLMQVLSGKILKTECHAGGCQGVRRSINITQSSRADGVRFYHDGNNNEIAQFKNGSIVFADQIEGNIFVVSE